MDINWVIYIIEIPLWWIHDYPEDIQEKYFETHERVPTELFTPTVAIKKGCALLFALALQTLYNP